MQNDQRKAVVIRQVIAGWGAVRAHLEATPNAAHHIFPTVQGVAGEYV